MAATADLWVYNAENFCVSFFNQVTSIFHLRGGKIKYIYNPTSAQEAQVQLYTKDLFWPQKLPRIADLG